jgi:hypothetical protein
MNDKTKKVIIIDNRTDMNDATVIHLVLEIFDHRANDGFFKASMDGREVFMQCVEDDSMIGFCCTDEPPYKMKEKEQKVGQNLH